MLRKSEFLKNTRIRILLCIEFILILAGIIGLFGKSGVIVGTEDTELLLTEGISLRAGVYTARLYYETEENAISNFGVTAEDTLYKGLLCNYSPIYSGINMRECRFYLLDDVEHLKVEVNRNGASTLNILAAEIVTGTEGSRIYLFWVVLFCIVLDGILMLSMYHRRQPIPVEKQLVIFGVPILALASSLPVMVDYDIIGADLIYHLMRIEALTYSIRQGELTSRISSAWLAGHGYASSIFYADTFLMIPALLCILGFSLNSAYLLFVTAVNLATAWISYFSFQKCFHNRLIGMFGCVLYTLAPYRMYNLYNRAAVGEYTAMIFLPLLVCGFYKIYTDDLERKGYLWNWVIPVIGFSGIIQSHALTCEMVGAVVVFMCLLLWKKTFRMRTFQVLTLTVVMTVVINAWFLVPFLDLMMADQYYFGHNANVLIQVRGVLPAHFFYTLQAAGASSRFAETGMVDTEPIGIGAALLLCVLIWIVLRFRHVKDSLSKEQRLERGAADLALALGCIVLFMSTCYFPWDFLSSCNRIFATLNGSLQFPTRLIGIATICMVMVACVMGRWLLRERRNVLTGAGVLILVSAVSIVFGSYQLNDTLLTRNEFVRVYTPQNMGYSAVLGAEYLPEGADIGHMTYHDPVLSEGVAMSFYEKKGLKVNAYVEADSGYIDFPMLYYKGYQAYAKENGQKLSVVKGENTDVRVLFPEGFSGEIQISYSGMWYWHMAEAVSMLSLIGLIVGYVFRYCKRRKQRCD